MSEDPNRPKRLKQLTGDIAQSYDSIQRKLTNKAVEAGYSRDIFIAIEPSLENLPEDPLLAHTESSLKNFRDYMRIKGALEEWADALGLQQKKI